MAGRDPPEQNSFTPGTRPSRADRVPERFKNKEVSMSRLINAGIVGLGLFAATLSAVAQQKPAELKILAAFTMRPPGDTT